VAALLLWLGALFLTLGLASFESGPGLASTGADWVGPVGAAFARAFVAAVGLVAWAVPVELVLLGIPFVRGKPSLVTPARVAGDFLIGLLAAALVQVGWAGRHAFGTYTASGAVGELFGELMRSLFSTMGSFLVGFGLLGLILIARASFSFIALMRWLGRMGATGAAKTASATRTVADAWRTARELEREEREKERLEALPRVVLPSADAPATALVPAKQDDSEPDLGAACEGALVEIETEQPPAAAPPADALVRIASDEAEPGRRTRARARKKARATEDEDEGGEEIAAAAATPEAEPVIAPTPTAEEDASPPSRARRAKATKVPAGPTIVDTSAALAKEPPKPERAAPKPGWKFPSMDLLIPADTTNAPAVDKDTLFRNAELLVKTLADYGVQGKVEEILPGPTVTTYEVSTAAGTKVSKVAGLADDLALALAKKVRILAPIPGKNRIGFELPNEKRIPVNLRDLVEDQRFQQLNVPLPVVLGRDIEGRPVYADLASMPHVIVAGATGAGKSVGLNVMLTSLLYRRSPEELRLLMVDPKVVELAPFDRIPHMLLPVVTDMKQASVALKWAVDEMERRYQLFADAGTKNITTYNGWVDRVCRGEAKNPLPKTVVGKDHNGLPDEIPAGKDEEGTQPLPERMPYIVLVVDEFADLMMQQGKEVEASVARLAQKARAAGMHVILATQRPSVDVITGMIKANFPTRIAFRVAQKVDSRTILDEQGAEHLLGRGDMLTKLNGTNDTRRVQCPMITEEEVQGVTDFLRAQGEPVYDENILKPREDDAEGGDDADATEQDSMYDAAVRLVAETRRCSTSWLQRKLGLGYNRAARIVEAMEKRGIVGPANGAKDREVLVSAL
jgi:S-DNA-T family DNA segregation ATPase FtsK/SpoIIIE